VQCCLARRVRSADDVHLLPCQRRRFDAGGAIKHSSAEEAVQIGDTESAVGDSGRNDHRASSGLASAVERYDVMIPARRKPDGPVGEHKLGAEQHRLLPRPVCEVATAQATREPQIIADQ
jgi:hypothetical protein